MAPCRDISAATNICIGLVNPALTARDHIFPRHWDLGSCKAGLSTPIMGNCGILATLGADLATNRR